MPLFLPFLRLWRRFKGHSLAWISLVSLTLVAACAVAYSYREGKTWQDSIWWAVVTVTTVGYGDFFPETMAGRIVGMILMLLGIGLLGFIFNSSPLRHHKKHTPEHYSFKRKCKGNRTRWKIISRQVFVKSS